MYFFKLFLLLVLGLNTLPTLAEDISEEEARAISTEAYLYFYPLISLEISRLQMTNYPSGKIPGHGPMNEFNHMRAFPDAKFRAVVRPNFDTLYSSAWLDLTKEPVLISMPDTAGRFYLLPMLDMWSDVIGAPGSRTTGTKAQVTAIVPAGWKGKLPKGVRPLSVTTPYLWLIGRIQTNGPSDYPAVNALQDKMSITPLSRWGKKPIAPVFKLNPSVDMKTSPLEQVNTMPAEKYFALAAELMKLNKPHTTDWSQIERFKKIGINVGESFDLSRLPLKISKALVAGASDGLISMKEKIPTLATVINGWSMNTTSMGVYGNYYLKRAIVAMIGLGANQPEDAVYPLLLMDNKGKPLVGEKKYQIHFKKDEIPPNDAFWSITMYDAQGFQVANSMNRFAIGSRDPLTYNSDGSLDLYIQNLKPSADKVSNWLPAPSTGILGLTMRIYAPKPSVLDGRWVPPAIVAK